MLAPAQLKVAWMSCGEHHIVGQRLQLCDCRRLKVCRLSFDIIFILPQQLNTVCNHANAVTHWYVTVEFALALPSPLMFVLLRSEHNQTRSQPVL